MSEFSREKLSFKHHCNAGRNAFEEEGEGYGPGLADFCNSESELVQSLKVKNIPKYTALDKIT